MKLPYKAGVAALAMFAASITLGASPGSTHTPSITASCSGVVIKATNYDGKKDNRWSVTIGGKTESGTFGESIDKTFPVPQGGATTEWSGSIKAHDGGYSQNEKGSVGPCGTPPVDHEWKYEVTCDAVSGSRPNTDSVDSNIRIKNLDTGVVQTFNYHGPDSGPSGPFSYSLRNDYKLPASWSYYEIQWVQVNGTNFHWEGALSCGSAVPPQPPELGDYSHWAGKPDCSTNVFTETRTKTVTPYVLSGREWVKGNPITTTETRTRPTSAQECPPVVVPPTEPPVVVPPVTPPVTPPSNPPTDKPEPPADKGEIGTPISEDRPTRERDEPTPAAAVLPDTGGPRMLYLVLGLAGIIGGGLTLVARKVL